MIKKILFSFSLLAATFLQSSAQTATTLVIPDTRNDATVPGQYSQNLKAQFKYYTSIGVPYTGSGYSTLLGFRGWYDNSGGKAHELTFTDDGSVFIRSGYDPNWEGWRRFLLENSSGFVGVGTVTPQRKLDVNGEAMVRSNFYAGDAVDDGLSSHIFGPGRFGPNNLVTFTSGANSYYTTLQLKTGARGVQGNIMAYEGLWIDADRHVYRTLNGSAFLAEINASGTNLNKLDAATSVATKFLIAEGGSNLIKYRTKEQLIADLGVGGSGWQLGGNTGTNPTTHFIGTSDNQGFAIRTNNVERLRIDATGKVGIGTINMSDEGYKLFVESGIRTRKVKVDPNSWADFVFEPTYQLLSLSDVEAFIKQHKHLPEVPTASEVKEKGLDLGENQAILLKKIEELTLYIIEQNKKLEQLEKEIATLKSK